jgi:YidC/Oxa1 family membrane protein insertase
VLNPLYDFVARAIVVIHSGIRHVVGDNGWAWALSIVILVAAVRLVLVPLFVKQIKTQRTMQVMQPKIKELKEKYKNDKQKMNEEMIKLQREHGNPLLGCLPTVLQIPLFLSLYRVMNGFSPKEKTLTAAQKAIAAVHGGYYPTHLNGLSVNQADQIAHAKIFGASLATSLLSKASVLHLLGSNGASTKVIAIVLIIVMMGTTYITQRQIIGRNGPASDANQAMTQKLLLYVSPLALGVFGIRISIGGLLYWFTTNFWSMAQQFIVIRRMPPVVAAGAGGAAGSAASRPGGPAAGPSAAKVKLKKGEPEPEPLPPPRLIQQRAVTEGVPAGTRPTKPPPPNRPGSNSKKRKNRRGGRH